MTPYVQREVFRSFEQCIFSEAVRLVAYVGNQWGTDLACGEEELRCHELARAVYEMLSVYVMRSDLEYLRVVDGVVGMVEHSWIEIATYPGRTQRERTRRNVILDVYCPGRLPQVQLIDTFCLLKPLYEERVRRNDIREDIVTRVVEEMRGRRAS